MSRAGIPKPGRSEPASETTQIYRLEHSTVRDAEPLCALILVFCPTNPYRAREPNTYPSVKTIAMATT